MARKSKKTGRDGRLAVVSNKKKQVQNKKSAMIDDKTQMSAVCHTKGRKSYAQHAKEQGLFIRITADIRRFRVSNPNSSYFDLYCYLHERYETVFDEKPNKTNTGSNFSKRIQAEPAWNSAYFAYQGDLIELAELRLAQILERDDIEDSVAIRAYDTLKKYEEVKIEEEDDSNKIVFGFSD